MDDLRYFAAETDFFFPPPSWVIDCKSSSSSSSLFMPGIYMIRAVFFHFNQLVIGNLPF